MELDIDVRVADDRLTTFLAEQWRERIDEISRLGVQLHGLREGADSDGLAARSVEQDLLERHLDAARQAAAELEAALQRVADGTYGTCERCLADIAPARLEALPAARLCTPCQAAAARE